MENVQAAARYFIEFAYNGTHYCGWQIQPDAMTVQQKLQEALSLLLREPIEVVGAGRTDAGVHASQMFAHFNTAQTFDFELLTRRLNSYLPSDIAVHRFYAVPADAHARFDAVARTYHYHIHPHKSPFKDNLSWYHFQALDVDKMNKAAQILLEYTDFECFSKTHTDVNTFNCKITEAYWTVNPDGGLQFTITADRFLRNMVRAIVGTLVHIGTGKAAIEHMHHVIQSKNRSQAGFSVPAHGLYLTQVKYPYL